MGDGDCGECFQRGAEGVLKALDDNKFKSARAVETLSIISEIIEDDMGGTSGGILALFVSALAGSVRQSAVKAKTNDNNLWSEAAVKSLEALRRYTPAKVGHRTLMDVLIPFVNELSSGTSDFGKAVSVAESAAEGTAKLTPKLGRATYVGVEGKTLPPDPGAYGVYAIIKGLYSGYTQ